MGRRSPWPSGGERVYITSLSEVAGYGFFLINSDSIAADSGFGSYWTAALSAADGTPVWTARYRPDPEEGARAWDVAPAPDGSRLYAAGRVTRSVLEADTRRTPSAYVTVAYEA